MKVELICVGSELVSGKILNTNASYISKKIYELGHSQTRQFTVADDMPKICELVENSLSQCDILIVTGGLGPTNDDLTKEAVCKALGLRLVENKKCKEHIEKYFEALGKTPTPNNFKQATAPEGAEIFKNERGTACGIGIEFEGKRIILLPGPPKELTHMFEKYVIPYLKQLERKCVVTHTLNVFGMGESAIETAIQPLFTSNNPVVVTYCQDNECEISITATADSEDEAERLCSSAIFSIKSLLGDVIYGTNSDGLATEVVKLLKRYGLKIATAESCTGGMLSQSLTSVRGASEVVEIGITAYSNRIKNEALSVPLDVLMEEGAISAETAMYLAKNVRMLSDADIGVGITGNAGPSASENKPVGLVYISVADRSKYYVTKLVLPASYSRDRIRNYATLTALDIVRKYILARPNSLSGMRSYDSDFFFEETAEETEVKKSNENFAVFEVDENFDLDAYESALSESKENVELDINSFIADPETDKPNTFSNIISFAKKHWIKLICALVLLALIITSSVLVGNLIHEGHQSALISSARESFDADNETKSDDTGVYHSFDKLMKNNSDIMGWLTIDGTEINNPIYQTSDNKYYQSHNMAKEKSNYGALFFDCDNVIAKDTKSKNLTVYGHNTTNGTMFGELDSYHSLSFYKSNAVIKLKTLYQQSEYLVFAVFITNADPKDDNGQIFNYARTDFKDSKDFNSFINEAKKRSLITVPIQVSENSEILTLSTYSDEFNNARFVVMAKKITSPNEAKFANKAILNPNTKYPQAWYDNNGLLGYKESESEITSSVIDEIPEIEGSSDITPSDDTSSPNNEANLTSSESSSSAPSSSMASSSTPVSSTAPSSSQTTSSVDPATCSHTPGRFEHKDAQQHIYICATCGTQITEAHTFTIERAEAGYLASAATCTAPATYYKSCKCILKGTETFTQGEALSHKASTEFAMDETQHWNVCQNEGCAEKLNLADHSYTDNKCICGKEAPTP